MQKEHLFDSLRYLALIILFQMTGKYNVIVDNYFLSLFLIKNQLANIIQIIQLIFFIYQYINQLLLSRIM